MKKTYALRSQTRPGDNQRTTSTSASSQRPNDPLPPRTQSDNTPAMESSIAELQKSFTEFSNRVCSKLDIIHTDLSSMKKKVSDLEVAAEDHSARMLIIEKEKLPQIEIKLQNEIDALKEKLLISEIYQRKSNLLFYGLEKKENESAFNVLRDAFMALGLTEEEAKSVAIANAHRLPSNRSKVTNAPEPIIAKFVYMTQRNRLLSAFERRPQRPGIDQVNSRISVRTDLPPALKAERGILAAKAYKCRKENNLSTKIVVAGSKVILYTKPKDSTEWQRHKE